MSYPAPDSKVQVVVTKWDGKCLIAMDANTNQYIHWLDDDIRWKTEWTQLIGRRELVLLARVGKKDGPRGRKMFVVNADVTVAQPEPVTRSPLDVFKAKGLDTRPLDIPVGTPTVSQVLAATDPVQKELDTTVEAIKHRPKPDHVASRNVRFEPYAVTFLEELQRKTGCKSLKEAAHKCVRMAMAYDS